MIVKTSITEIIPKICGKIYLHILKIDIPTVIYTYIFFHLGPNKLTLIYAVIHYEKPIKKFVLKIKIPNCILFVDPMHY